MAKIYGNLICQNGISEIVRCIESVAPLVDEYYVVDGFSTDGTWEWLNKWKDVYNLKLFQNKFENMAQQRNFLLEKTPKDSWVITIDQDEKLGVLAQLGIKPFIESIELTPTPYPLVISIPLLNLVGDINHHEDGVCYNSNKVFYYEEGIKFAGGYHSYLTKDGSKEQYFVYKCPDDWGIMHYAWLDKDRVAKVQDDIKSGKRDYQEYKDGFKPREVLKINII